MTAPRCMLDTNAVILAAVGRNEALRARLRTFTAGALVLSAITWAELERGWRAGHADPSRTDPVLSLLPILPFGADAAAAYGRVMASAPRGPKGSFDRLIAAHALSLGLTIVTGDKRGFAGVAGLDVEDWHA